MSTEKMEFVECALLKALLNEDQVFLPGYQGTGRTLSEVDIVMSMLCS